MYTIKDVSDKTGVSVHTLRFWAKSGFFPSIVRDKNNIRMFSENDLGWVQIVKCLRAVGTQNKDIKKYIDLCIEGDSTIPERFDIIKATKKHAIEQMQTLQQQLDLLDYKENYYQNLINNNLQDNYNPIHKIGQVKQN